MVIDTITFFIIIGVVLYVFGISWLLYLDIMYKRESSANKSAYYNSVAYAVLLSAVGIFVSVVCGMIQITLS